MKQYISHRRVRALQLTSFGVGGWSLGDDLTDPGSIMSAADLAKFHRDDYTPAVGDYLVEYWDGYRSISPKAAFEGGYAEVLGGESAIFEAKRQSQEESNN